MVPNDNVHWRDTARQTKFFFVDAYAAFPILIMLLHIKLWTFLLSLACIVFFAVLERFKFTIPVFFRWLKVMIGGTVKLAKPWWRE